MRLSGNAAVTSVPLLEDASLELAVQESDAFVHAGEAKAVGRRARTYKFFFFKKKKKK